MYIAPLGGTEALCSAAHGHNQPLHQTMPWPHPRIEDLPQEAARSWAAAAAVAVSSLQQAGPAAVLALLKLRLSLQLLQLLLLLHRHTEHHQGSQQHLHTLDLLQVCCC